MADLKAAFKAAKEQRGITKLTPAQVRALKASKQQQGPSAAQLAPAPTPVTAAKAKQAAGVPDDFFQSAAPSSSSQPAPQAAPKPASKPAAPARAVGPAIPTGKAGQGAGPLAASLPEGFFADKAADAKVRGIKLPDEKDREDEFQAFQRSIEEDMKKAAVEEAVVAEEEADDREDREDFAQWVRLQRIEEMKKRKRSGTSEDGEGEGPSGVEEVPESTATAATVTAEMLGLATSMPDGLGGITLPKKPRLKDTLAMLQSVEEDEGSSSGDQDDDGVLLDWRAKNL